MTKYIYFYIYIYIYIFIDRTVERDDRKALRGESKGPQDRNRTRVAVSVYVDALNKRLLALTKFSLFWWTIIIINHNYVLVHFSNTSHFQTKKLSVGHIKFMRLTQPWKKSAREDFSPSQETPDDADLYIIFSFFFLYSTFALKNTYTSFTQNKFICFNVKINRTVRLAFI